MSDQNQQNDQKSGINPLAAAAVGAAIGAAAVGIAGAAIMANDKGRKKVEKTIDDAKDKVGEMKENVEEKVAEGQEKVGKVISAMEDVAKAAK